MTWFGRIAIQIARGISAATLVAAVATTTSAQQPVRLDLASLRLRVLRDDERPVSDAEVTIKTPQKTRVARTDSTGDSRFDGLTTGFVQLRVRRPGFSSIELDAEVTSGDNALDVHIDDLSSMMNAVHITGERVRNDRLADYESRLKLGAASAVITSAQIDKRNPIALSQMLRGIAGIRLADSLGSIVAISTRGKVMNKKGLVDCVMRMAVDGMPVAALSNIDGIVPRDVHGVEVFFGPSRIPLTMGSTRTDNWCGLIAIWTKQAK